MYEAESISKNSWCRLFLQQLRKPSPAQPCVQLTEGSSSAGWAAVPITDDENLIIDFNGS